MEAVEQQTVGIVTVLTDKYFLGKAQVLEQKGQPNNFKVFPVLLYFDLKPLHKIVYLSTTYILAAQSPSILVCVISSG